MNIFEKIQKQKLDVTIDIVPKLEGSPFAFSEYKVEVPHLGKTIMVSVPNNIGIKNSISQMHEKCEICLKK